MQMYCTAEMLKNNHVQKEKSRWSATFAVTYFDESRYVKFH